MKNTRPRVSLVFPVYGQSKLLLKALTTLREVTRYPNYEVIVVDDCSKENMDGVYSKEYLYDKLIRLPKNIGNSTTVVNEGVKISSGEFIQYQNNDVYFEDPEWLDKIIDSFDEDTAVVGPALLYQNKTIQSAGLFFDKRGLNRHLYRYRLYETIEKETKEVPMVTGCGLTTRRDIYDKLRGFRVYRPHGWDDSDWCLRVRDAGFKVKLCLGSYFYHLGTVSYRGRDNPKYHSNRKEILKRFKNFIERDSRFKLPGKKYIFFLDNLVESKQNFHLLSLIQKSGFNKKNEILIVPRDGGGLKPRFQKEGVRIFPSILKNFRSMVKDYYNLYRFLEGERPDFVFYGRTSKLLLFPLRVLSKTKRDLGTFIELALLLNVDEINPGGGC